MAQIQYPVLPSSIYNIADAGFLWYLVWKAVAERLPVRKGKCQTRKA